MEKKNCQCLLITKIEDFRTSERMPDTSLVESMGATSAFNNIKI